MLIVYSLIKLILDLVLLRVDPPFEESEFIKPIQYNKDTAISVPNEVSMFKWQEASEDKICKSIEVNGLLKQVFKTPIKIFGYDPEFPIGDESIGLCCRCHNSLGLFRCCGGNKL